MTLSCLPMTTTGRQPAPVSCCTEVMNETSDSPQHLPALNETLRHMRVGWRAIHCHCGPVNSPGAMPATDQILLITCWLRCMHRKDL